MDELNKEQRRAVELINGPVVIKAGPGTGKTKTLVAKIIHLIDLGINPKNILAITFTKKSTEEIKLRLQRELKRDSKIPHVHTFHSLSYEILLDMGQKIQVVSQDKKLNLLKQLQQSLPELKTLNLKEIELKISRMKNSLYKDETVSLYQKLLKENSLVDFDDLLINTLNYLNNSTRELKELQSQFKYMLLDEFQDTNQIQYKFIKLLAGDVRNITVIGDPLQSIYKFRGADSSVFGNFQNDFKPKEIDLVINYRSLENIVNIGNSLYPFENNLKAFHKEEKGKVAVVETLDGYTEADWIINRIEELIGGSDLNNASAVVNREKETARFSDFAILYRVHGIGRVIETKLREKGIPFKKAGIESLYTKKDIDFVVTFLRFLAEGKDENLLKLISHPFLNISDVILKKINNLKVEDKDLMSVLKLMITQKHLTQSQSKILSLKLDQLIKILERTQGRSLNQIIVLIVESYKLEERMSSQKSMEINELINNTRRFGEGVESIKSFLKYFEEIQEQDYFDENADKVSLLTIHFAKGLEFKYVFIIGFEEGLIPYKLSIEEGNIDEEKRLLYVAVTRAKRELNIIYTQERIMREKSDASSFLKQFDEEYYEFKKDEAIKKVIKSRAKYKAKKSQIGFNL